MDRVWQFGTVRIEATGLMPTQVRICDLFGQRREFEANVPDLDAADWATVAGLHVRFSQYATRRN